MKIVAIFIQLPYPPDVAVFVQLHLQQLPIYQFKEQASIHHVKYLLY